MEKARSLKLCLDSVSMWVKLKWEEDSKEYGSPVVSASTIADVIKSRTKALLKKTKTSVSPKPIVMRAEFAHCPNLNIIDTPGFDLKLLGDSHGFSDSIECVISIG
ncbi:dynamin-related protein 5A-like [Gossypium hirsutum]|uniref:Dynamin-related protein 5A-like n=1 Tax=Gossypium hirsutum TaxID=3635 RepID=A0ABM3AGY6_GOSHI|nr:dynamin-related protein 5A-like [Gossypium hirsutum]